MKNKPLLSIILPTRNRSMVIEEAIKSVINQKFQDWELIIVDNNTAEDTYLVVRSYLNTKIKYVRTGELAMHDNWQKGIEYVQGTYITILEDKATYTPNTFEQISNLIESNPDAQLIVMGYTVGERSNSLPVCENPKIYSFSSTEVLQLILYEPHIQINPILPKMIFSWCHRSVIDWCKEQNETFFQPYSPDYSSMFIQLAYFDRIQYIEAPLIHFNNQYSNGGKFVQKGYGDPVAQDFLRLSTGGSFEPLTQYTKIKIGSHYNILMSDYEHIRQKFFNKLTYHPMSAVQVYKETIQQIYDNEHLGINMEDERKMLFEELQQQPQFIRMLVEKYEDMVKSTFSKGYSDYSSLFLEEIVRSYLLEGKKIAIWGAGEITKHILDRMGNEAKLIDCVVDGSAQKQGQILVPYDMKIYPPIELLQRNIDILLVSTYKWQVEVEAQVKALGLKCKVLSPSRIKDFLILD